MIRWVLIFVLLASSAAAEARFDPDRSSIRDGWRSVQMTLGLSEIVPYRIFTLDDPRRLVVDFEGLDTGGQAAGAINSASRVTDIRFGPFRSGWTRMVLDLAEPLALAEAEMAAEGGRATLTIRLRRTTPAAFSQSAGAPADAGWEGLTSPALAGLDLAEVRDDFVVVLDPGHGGIDPGAERGGITEADLMLRFAEEIAESLRPRDGISVVLTRTEDVFVPLYARMTIARVAGADLFISLHADALEADDAWGASIYTLSEGSADMAMQRLVERHERGDLLAGVDLAVTDDRVTSALMDMARRTTAPRAATFADHLVAQMRARDVRLNSHPRREGRFSVLLAADFPSVLIEAGFLSNARDRENLSDPVRRGQLVTAITVAVIDFAQP